MVTRNPKWLVKTGVGCRRWIKFDLRLDSVKNLGLSGYAGPFHLEDELETEAHPENRFFPPPSMAKGLGLGVLVGVPGTRGENDQVGSLTGLIVDSATIQNQYLVQSGKEMLEVAGEGILMVGQKDHARRSSRACALILFSLYSYSGVESTTMPPPAWA